jgi:hypothetical protein
MKMKKKKKKKKKKDTVKKNENLKNVLTYILPTQRL